MKEKTAIFYFIAIALLYLCYEMFSPFLLAIFWAVVFSIILYPLYALLRTRLRNADIAALIVVIVSLLLVIGPLSYLSYLLVSEIKDVVTHSNERSISAAIFGNSSISSALERVARLLNVTVEEVYSSIYSLANRLKGGLVRILQENAFVVVHALVDYFIMLFTIFFLLRDQQVFVEKLNGLLPLSDSQKDHLMIRIKEVIISTMYGGVLVAAAHGLVGGVAFFFLGVPSPILLGFAMAVASFVPVIGAFTIWGPVTAYLFISGSVIKGIIMLVTGVVGIVGIIDHVLKPKIIGRRTKIHTVLIFFGVLGGIHLFGVIGFIAGPLLIAVLMIVLEIIEQRLSEDGQLT